MQLILLQILTSTQLSLILVHWPYFPMVSQMLETVSQAHGSDAHNKGDLKMTPPDLETQWQGLLRYATSVRGDCPTSAAVYVPLSKHADLQKASSNMAKSSKATPAQHYAGLI